MSKPLRKSLADHYSELEAERSPYLQRAEEASALTIPWFLPKEGAKDARLPKTHQSIGAEGVTNLASRLTTVHMPPNRPFFRLHISRKLLNKATDQEKAMIPAIESGLSRMEREVLSKIEAYGDRASVYIANLHLIVAGNVLVHIIKDGIRIFPLRSYVVQRDPDGNVLLIIVKEEIAYDALPEDIRKKIKRRRIETPPKQDDASEKDTYEIYTSIRRIKNRWLVCQECEDMMIGTPGHYPLNLCPWLPLRMFRCEQESYGRGYVEMYRGDLNSCEVLTKALDEASAAAAKVLFLVHPNAVTKPNDLTRADNLAFVAGKKDDVDVLQLEKYNDLQVAEKRIDKLEHKLAEVFLLHSAVQRDAERVTAEEIRYMAQELESMLGGLYSLLAKEWQQPYARLRINYLKESGDIEIPKGVDYDIITGVDALGRGQEASSLTEFMTVVTKFVQPQQVQQYFKVDGLLRTLAAAYGIDDAALMKTPEEMSAETQDAQGNALMQRVAPNLVNAGASLMQKGMETGALPTE